MQIEVNNNNFMGTSLNKILQQTALKAIKSICMHLKLANLFEDSFAWFVVYFKHENHNQCNWNLTAGETFTNQNISKSQTAYTIMHFGS